MADIAGGLRNVLPGPLDQLMGPYTSLAAACTAIPNTVTGGKNYREGKFAIVLVGSLRVLHWWDQDYTDAGLKPITSQYYTKEQIDAMIVALSPDAEVLTPILESKENKTDANAKYTELQDNIDKNAVLYKKLTAVGGQSFIVDSLSIGMFPKFVTLGDKDYPVSTNTASDSPRNVQFNIATGRYDFPRALVSGEDVGVLYSQSGDPAIVPATVVTHAEFDPVKVVVDDVSEVLESNTSIQLIKTASGTTNGNLVGIKNALAEAGEFIETFTTELTVSVSGNKYIVVVDYQNADFTNRVFNILDYYPITNTVGEKTANINKAYDRKVMICVTNSNAQTLTLRTATTGSGFFRGTIGVDSSTVSSLTFSSEQTGFIWFNLVKNTGYIDVRQIESSLDDLQTQVNGIDLDLETIQSSLVGIGTSLETVGVISSTINAASTSFGGMLAPVKIIPANKKINSFLFQITAIGGTSAYVIVPSVQPIPRITSTPYALSIGTSFMPIM